MVAPAGRPGRFRGPGKFDQAGRPENWNSVDSGARLPQQRLHLRAFLGGPGRKRIGRLRDRRLVASCALTLLQTAIRQHLRAGRASSLNPSLRPLRSAATPSRGECPLRELRVSQAPPWVQGHLENACNFARERRGKALVA